MVLAILSSLTACTQCYCLPRPDGPLVDMTALTPRMRHAFDGFSGTVADLPRNPDWEAPPVDPCSYAGLAFAFDVDVGDPSCRNCQATRTASFPLSGTLTLDGVPLPVTGSVALESWRKDGVRASSVQEPGL